MERLANLEKLDFKVPYKGVWISKQDSDILRDISERISNSERYLSLKKKYDEDERLLRMFRRVIKENPYIFINFNDKDYNKIVEMCDRIDMGDK